jgi:hypothetical protein
MDDVKCRYAFGGVCRHIELPRLPAVSERCDGCDKYAGPARGLGDVVKKVADATGVSKVAPKGCGCQRRREALNRILPNPLKGS